MMNDPRLQRQVEQHPYPLLFATISGAHLYGFPSPDSDYDLRGVHLLPLKQVVGLHVDDETIEKSGIHLMRTGEIEANLGRLNETARLPYVPDLIARKVGGPETGRIEQTDLEFHEREYNRLLSELQAAFERSGLPETPSAADALHDLLVRLRLDTR